MIKAFFRYYINPFFWGSLIRRKYFIPDMTFKSLIDVNAGRLRKLGIKGIILDADNTMTEHHGTSFPEGIGEKVKELKSGFKVCIVSNMLRKRRNTLKRNFGIDVIKCSIKKPAPEPFLEAMRFMRTRPETTAVIGDRYLTDIVGAKRLGIRTIKVSAIDEYSEPLILRMARWLEEFIYRILSIF